ncbi:MAG TPA: GNAT family N-acetyltransferase [Moheibacter sp.]|nr:GNAT family N-acetyltransferase [Moheibacter sp.]
MNWKIRKATLTDANAIWTLLQIAIARRKADGSQQWQNGYPNPKSVENDIKNGFAYVMTRDDEIIGTAALIINDEPTYENIDGAWLSDEDFMVVHRVSVSDKVLGKGIATKFFELMEGVALEQQIFNIKIDTNFDNLAMLRILEKLNYVYCGEIQVQDGKRKAFQKVLK